MNLSNIVDIFNENDPASGDEEDRLSIWAEYLSTLQQLIISCRGLAAEWEAYIDSLHSNPYPDCYQAPLIYRQNFRGRPPFQISEDQLHYLASLSFTWSEIATLLNVSRMTIYRRRRDFNMLELSRSTLTYSQLKVLIRNWKLEMPTIGESLVIGRLHASGHYVQRDRVRHALRAVDPLNTALRSPHGLTRRQPYSVPAPNSLWHIGNVTRIKWDKRAARYPLLYNFMHV